MNAEEINNQEFHAMREKETKRTKVRDEDQEYEMFMCPIMRFPNAKKAKSGAEFFDGAYEYCHVFAFTEEDAKRDASITASALNKFTSEKVNLKIVGDEVKNKILEKWKDG